MVVQAAGITTGSGKAGVISHHVLAGLLPPRRTPQHQQGHIAGLRCDERRLHCFDPQQHQSVFQRNPVGTEAISG